MTDTAATTSTLTVNPFDVTMAQFVLDTAGFHGMAETLSDTRKIDTAYLSPVNRVHKVLSAATWPSELNDEAQAFLGLLTQFADALTAEDVAKAVALSEQVHDAQHEFSHHIDAWIGTASAH